MGESGRKNVCKLHTTLSSETPSSTAAAVPLPRRGRLGNGTCLPLINIPLIPTIIILFSWLYKGKFNFEFSLR